MSGGAAKMITSSQSILSIRQQTHIHEMSSRRDSDFARLEQLLQEERRKTRPTTFEEYIRACHALLSKPLRIQTDKSLSTQGSITSPKNKPCPTFLKPWTDFPILQQQLFEKVYEFIPPEEEYFSSTQYLKELGQDLCDRPLASEKDLETYQRLAVERPTTNIISHLQRIEEARRAFNLGEGIIFENHANTLSDSNEEVQQSLQNLRISNKGPASSSNPKPRNADQICVYKDADGKRSLCMVVEYKPSHKLSVFNLRAGLLRADGGSMNVPEDVINRLTIPTQPDEKFVYHSEWLTAAALTQTYAYMIENGLEYSKLVTGEADVLLQVMEDEPHTLYYHLAEPNIEAEAQSEVDILLCRTAVGQTLTFCLMALDSKPRSQKWRNQALETAYRAAIDHEAILRQIPTEEKTLTPPPSVFHARIHPVKRSPIMLRPRKSRKARNSCGSADMIVHEDPQSPSGSSDETSDVETPSKPRARTRQSSTGQVRPVKSLQAAEESDVRHRQYCTQACLLGLVRKHPLDGACPNINAHRAHGAGSHHALERKSLAKLMSRQLAQDPENGCEPLGKQGARGALFRLTLESYGYTFVAKGTVTAFEAKVKHEGLVYQHLDEVQGELIPVYLGNISLVCPYFLDLGVRIVHMLLMSWAGEQARKDLVSSSGRDMDEETARAVKNLRYHGVEHRDVRPPNVLWNPEGRKVMLVDFERSEILKQLPILQEVSPNRKRKHLHSTKGRSRSTGPPYQRFH
jgi:signal recognition particle subunit SEC65